MNLNAMSAFLVPAERIGIDFAKNSPNEPFFCAQFCQSCDCDTLSACTCT